MRVANGIVYHITYTVTYYDGETELSSETVIEGLDCADMPTPEKESDGEYTYTFAGWAATAGGSVDATLTSNIQADANLYAVFTATPIEEGYPGFSDEEGCEESRGSAAVLR